MVTSLLFHSQSKLRKDGNLALEEIFNSFLTWMKQDKHSEQLRQELAEHPWLRNSEIIFLSRYFVRFYEEKYARPRLPEAATHTPGWEENVGETTMERYIANTLSSQLLDSFWMSLRELPVGDRLVFQFYLEGLLPEEISALLMESQASVNEKINTCKMLLGQGIAREVA